MVRHPQNHELDRLTGRQCRWYSYTREYQCLEHAIKGFDYCTTHRYFLKAYNGSDIRLRSAFMGQLTHLLQGKFKELLLQAEQETPEAAQKLDLLDEVAAARIIASRALAIYDSLVLADGANAEKASPALKDAASRAAKDAISHIAAIAEKAAKVHVLMSDRTEDLSAQFLESVSAIIASSMEATPTLRDEIIGKIKMLQLQKVSSGGVVITL